MELNHEYRLEHNKKRSTFEIVSNETGVARFSVPQELVSHETVIKNNLRNSCVWWHNEVKGYITPEVHYKYEGGYYYLSNGIYTREKEIAHLAAVCVTKVAWKVRNSEEIHTNELLNLTFKRDDKGLYSCNHPVYGTLTPSDTEKIISITRPERVYRLEGDTYTTETKQVCMYNTRNTVYYNEPNQVPVCIKNVRKFINNCKQIINQGLYEHLFTEDTTKYITRFQGQRGYYFYIQFKKKPSHTERKLIYRIPEVQERNSDFYADILHFSPRTLQDAKDILTKITNTLYSIEPIEWR